MAVSMEHSSREDKDTLKMVKGHIVDALNRRVYDGEITIRDGIIAGIRDCDGIPADAPYILPGFVDSHVHIESSMMLPSEFARIALRHGTVAAVCDPHEIANVLGRAGIGLMMDNAKGVPFHFAFGVPSCVPSCSPDIETSGFVLDSREVAEMLKLDGITHLSEMMNYPGVLYGDSEVLAKIAAAKAVGKPVDGHAPGLRGEERRQYAAAGISTDHECSSLEEAREVIRNGMFVQIREGSAAKNYSALAPLIAESPDKVMLCTDDSHPTDLVNGHINRLVARALADGYDLMDILQAACINPVRHYKLPVGLLQTGSSADFICISDTTKDFRVLDTYIAGQRRSDVPKTAFEVRDSYQSCIADPVRAEDLEIPADLPLHVIVAGDGSLLTGHETHRTLPEDCQKLVCYNRYTAGARPKAAFIRGFNMKHGAIAQTIAHDCHNIVAIGTDGELLAQAINRIISMKGGIYVTDGIESAELELPVAGLISPLDGDTLAEKNRRLEAMVSRTGCTMHSPFITLAFMCLPVIPDLKLTDKGLFDGKNFRFVE